MPFSIRIEAEPVRSLAFGSIGAAYMGVGTSIDRPARMILIQNLTDESLMFSFDGVNDHFPLAASGYLLLDITSNKTVDLGFYLPEHERLYVKEIGNPTTGSVYFTTFYGDHD